MLDLIIIGFVEMLTLANLLLIIFGVIVGILFGAIPGLSATMAIALMLPVTYGMAPISGFALLIGLYIGGISGGLISAILLRIPGTPSSIATTFDGSPMALRGEAGKALGIGIVYSFIGGMISIIILTFISPPIANIALKFGPYEYFAVGIFSLTMIASLVSGNVFKGLASGILGLIFAMVGAAPIDSAKRFTFGINALDAGFNILPVLIGLYAVSEIIKVAECGVNEDNFEISNYKLRGFGFSVKEFVGQTWNMFRSAFIGLGVGILPGIGGGTSNILAYTVAKDQSKYPEKFGTGIMDGIVASETANNASVGGALIPLLTLGIPGDTVTALLLGGLMVHGLNPGPLLFKNNAELVYGIFAALFIANIAMLILEFLGLRAFVKLLSIPKNILLPIIMVLCTVGAYGLNNRVFDIFTILLFGVIGYLLEKNGFPLPPIILGFILGPIIEVNLIRGLMVSQGSFVPFITRPISAVFLLIAAVSFILSMRKNIKNTNKTQTESL
ncbi:tripartite tricarboxylate transporter permease [Natronincola ferrireducens]|uniref:Putative tricarboxylic transport membrane protein n=1 Tax=Natronincola ferrireducens TaxID=393762 RepID=A0A1G9GFZ6_9FIRM|nr:tripartite tricarboxylate transporter permease [Natronincola ferrireducens]SDK99173.1 putative tricarboxylic transport membrane protein [Natronincola ferrireducens]